MKPALLACHAAVLTATLLGPSHPILAGINEPLPPILGLNKLEFRGDATSTLLAVCQYRGNDWPLLAVRNYGRGRSLIWSTDIGPHWLDVAMCGSSRDSSRRRLTAGTAIR